MNSKTGRYGKPFFQNVILKRLFFLFERERNSSNFPDAFYFYILAYLCRMYRCISLYYLTAFYSNQGVSFQYTETMAVYKG